MKLFFLLLTLPCVMAAYSQPVPYCARKEYTKRLFIKSSMDFVSDLPHDNVTSSMLDSGQTVCYTIFREGLQKRGRYSVISFKLFPWPGKWPLETQDSFMQVSIRAKNLPDTFDLFLAIDHFEYGSFCIRLPRKPEAKTISFPCWACMWGKTITIPDITPTAWINCARHKKGRKAG
jgi:hypothetical protein